MKIRAEGLTRDYGRFRALDHVNLTIVSAGSSRQGPNGAGKTTLLRLLMGLLEPTEARSWLLGVQPAEICPRRLYRGAGYMGDAESPAGLRFVRRPICRRVLLATSDREGISRSWPCGN